MDIIFVVLISITITKQNCLWNDELVFRFLICLSHNKTLFRVTDEKERWYLMVAKVRCKLANVNDLLNGRNLSFFLSSFLPFWSFEKDKMQVEDDDNLKLKICLGYHRGIRRDSIFHTFELLKIFHIITHFGL